jgi:hypothetical protein
VAEADFYLASISLGANIKSMNAKCIQQLLQNDISEANIICIATDSNGIKIRINLWNNKIITLTFTEWLYVMYTNGAFAELSNIRALERSPLVIRMANEFCSTEQSINQALDDYIELQFWDVDSNDQPALTLVVSEFEVSEVHEKC